MGNVLVVFRSLEEELLQDLLSVLRAGDSVASDTGVVIDLVVVAALEEIEAIVLLET